MPSLLLDKNKCLRNIERMASVASEHGLDLRPHFKTHQSAHIGNWFREFGVKAIAVSSFQMADYFARAGWEDILVAFPFHPGEINTLNRLLDQSRISILIDNREALSHVYRLNKPVPFYIDIDTGYGRTGIRSDAAESIQQLLEDSPDSGKLIFSGFYCHAGNSYKAASQSARENIHMKALTDLRKLKQQFRQYAPRVLYGDTPNCSTQKDFRGVDELTPGNFVFYDLFQSQIGSCTPEEIAVAMACPVAGKYPAEGRILVHGGAVHFSKETMEVGTTPVYGRLVQSSGKGWVTGDREYYLTSVSQEHGIIAGSSELMEEFRIGDLAYFLPVHSCLTANLMREYVTLDGLRISTMNS
ncbi:MAG: alanine racemase [Bacteroidales bacterium]